MPEEAKQRRRTLARTLVVMVLTAISLALTAPDLALPWHGVSTFGFGFDHNGTIYNVVPGYAAAEAGIVDGDQVDLKATPASTRELMVGWYIASEQPGKQISLTVRHGGAERHVTLYSKPQVRSLADNVSDVILVISGWIFAIIASTLVLLRPSRMTWAFYLYAITANIGSIYLTSLLSFDVDIAATAFIAVTNAVGALAFVSFAMRFPSDVVAGRMKTVESALLPIAVVFAAAQVYAVLGPILLGVTTHAITKIVEVAIDIFFCAAIAAVLWRFATSPAEDRQRIKWVILGLILGFGLRYAVLLFVPHPSIWLGNLLYSANVLLPIALAYAIVRHRVIDVSFFVSRTIVYGALTGLVIALFGIMDWFFTSFLSLAKAGTAAEIATAIGLGFWLKSLHNQVDYFIDAVFFRRRHAAEVRLARLAKALPHATSIDAVAETLVDSAADALELSSAALFVKSASGAFVRVRASNWTDATAMRFEPNDLLVLQLSAEQRPLSLVHADYDRAVMPAGQAHPTIAVAIAVRNELRAIALYGPHRRGDDLDPDEVSALDRLATGACAALDHAQAVSLQKQVQESAQLSQEIEAIHTELAQLRAALAT